ncbi:methionyl-tRNA formyltransferase [Fructilactobacillus fructivorans]|uniref:Methionyl-tRNA formyltransferase n=1 Tax=Fructilactobacillus fructivorans TaxID=1614 RepID=A0AAE6P1B4_9LACO|nr:methionyl-tRNA formyltransferase [Fructilactobacillus fructivorans]KRK58595.1 methionyl-tRNA formyltransferase [Fructilactobacillus fructivorans]KRN13502.1 methionyl-tRNA formyltransferase [Fructilactobacillus fructivorans]KRN40148.1 methionyl-tRNA formyltransferase [Fructilactobacillus fructivorans]KRN43520.1 methionyl-tRNA formyltransferase [Fructilactobacillus fructivorans]QFX92602.1 methionyl-tRNA formyltransferase [Fructilactobacillus fructivorans]
MKSVVFMGTPDFSVPILKALNDNYNVLAVVTQPDRPVGRKHQIVESPVKQASKELGLSVLQPQKLSGSDEMEQIIQMKPDFIITAAFGQFLPTKLLKAAQIADVNVHGSLLPKYRGGAPVQYAIMNGDQVTGISIMYMVKKMDAGDVLAQQSVEIEDTDDTESMFKKLSLVGRDLLLKTLPKIIDGTVQPQKQDENRVVFAPNIKREQEELDFALPARAVDAKVRALRPDPTAFAMIDGKPNKIWKTEVINESTNLDPGQIVNKDKHHLQVAAGDGTVIGIDEIQPAGKPQKSITEYLNGHQKLEIGDQFIDRK